MVSLSLYNPLEAKFTIKRPVFILFSKIVNFEIFKKSLVDGKK